MLLNRVSLFRTTFKIWSSSDYADFFVIQSAFVQNEARVSFAIKLKLLDFDSLFKYIVGTYCILKSHFVFLK